MEPSKKHKLLIVDDSAFMRKVISDFFHQHPSIEVIGTARNGKDAIQKIQQLNPDVVTMDVEMPELNGIETLKHIMEISPVPVVMISSFTEKGAQKTLQAMEYGAVDFVTKPGGTISLDLHKVKDELIRKVELASKIPIEKLRKQINPKKHYINNIQQETTLNTNETQVVTEFSSTSNKNWTKTSEKIVLIGTSTGGPRALQEVMTNLPESLSAPILIVQHMPPGFTKSLADRLNHLSKIRVKEAEQGEIVEKGTAYIAPGGYHLKMKKNGQHYQIVLDNQEPPRAGHRPSVDVLFENISQFNELDKIAIIMTGMGNDGSKGLMALKKSGNVIAIAESAETCIVYGMPKAAVETKLVDEVVNLDDISETMMKYLS
ncbi:chemotaxis response regulator protein-glutamate methylesterase [Ureibacillus thermosphaericus]